MAKKPKKQAAEQVETAVAEAAADVIATAKSRGPRGVKEDAVITVLAETNPNREGSQSHTDFAQYQTGMTVGAFIDAVGKRGTPHLVYDAAHGFISIEGYDPAQVAPKVKKEKAVKEPKAPRAKKAKAAPAEATPEQTELEGLTVEESLD
jgi:hypothetical protein